MSGLWPFSLHRKKGDRKGDSERHSFPLCAVPSPDQPPVHLTAHPGRSPAQIASYALRTSGTSRTSPGSEHAGVLQVHLPRSPRRRMSSPVPVALVGVRVVRVAGYCLPSEPVRFSGLGILELADTSATVEAATAHIFAIASLVSPPNSRRAISTHRRLSAVNPAPRLWRRVRPGHVRRRSAGHRGSGHPSAGRFHAPIQGGASAG